MIIQLQRYYALWKSCIAAMGEWSKGSGTVAWSKIFILYSFVSNGKDK